MHRSTRLVIGSGGPRAWRAGLLTAALGVLPAPGLAQQPRELEPVWSRSPAAGVEWCELVNRAAHPVLVMATRDAELDLCNPRTGDSLLSETIDAQPGVQLANPPISTSCDKTGEGTASLLYAYDRYRIHALILGDTARLAWRAGRWPDDMSGNVTSSPTQRTHFQDDPEFLRRITAAAATAGGLLVARSDGQAALLDARDGRVAREMTIPATTNVQAFARGDKAVFLGRREGTAFGEWLELDTGTRRRLPLPSTTASPLWAALTEHGLLVAYADAVHLCRPDEEPRLLFRPDEAQLLAATLRLCALPDSTDATCAKLLILGTSDGRLHACDALHGKLLWSVADELDVAPHWSLLKPGGRWLIAASGSDVRVRDLRDGSLCRAQSAPGGENIIDADFRDETLWLCWKPPNDDEPLVLEAVDLSAQPTTAASAPAAPRRRIFSLAPAEELLGACWSDNRLMVTTRREVRAYALP